MSQRNEALFETHGVAPQYTPAQGVAVGNVLLIALGTGGPLSPAEMEKFVSIATEYGATPDAIEAWKRIDYVNGKISDHARVPPGGDPPGDHLPLDPRLARHLLYEAIRICRVAAPTGPVPKLVGVARALGLDISVLAPLDAMMIASDALHKARAPLTAAAKDEPRAGAGATAGLEAIAAKEVALRKMLTAMMETGKPA